MNSVRLYYIKHQGKHDLTQIDSNLTEQWLTQLSDKKSAAIQRLLHIQNRITSLIGLRLLAMCAQDEGIEGFRLDEVQYPETGKPYWRDRDNGFDFNISHSGDMIVVAASSTSKLGVDVEQIRELKRLRFKMVLSEDELSEIQQTPIMFFDLWSKKEAVVKAADTTGIARMRDVRLEDNSAQLDETIWYLKTIGLDDGYAVNLASEASVDNLIIKQIPLTRLK